MHGAPVYVRHEIVHNKYVVDSLKAKGAIFVEELDEVPAGDAPVIFSAHGVPKSVPAEAERRGLNAIDATCPLVTKVHREAQAHFKRGRHIILIGHAGHPEVVGTLGPVAARRDHPGRRQLARSRRCDVPDGKELAFVTQTTLSVDDTRDVDRGAEGDAFPLSRAARRGHLLRHHQPPGGGEGGRASRSTR